MSYLYIYMPWFLLLRFFVYLILTANLKIKMMKNFLCLLSAFLLVLTSCSNDDKDCSNEEEVALILVKQRIMVGEDGKTSTANVLYDGNKIVSITEEDGSVYKYTYAGDVISKTEEIDKEGKIDKIAEYDYTNRKLTTVIEKKTDDEYYYKTKYVHNTDGTVTYEKLKCNVVTGVEEEYGAFGKYTFKDGNLVKSEISFSGTEIHYVSEYDIKNNPFKNVLGLNLLINILHSANNIVKTTSTSGSGDNIITSVVTYDYKYDANNYPTEKLVTFDYYGESTVIETTQFVY